MLAYFRAIFLAAVLSVVLAAFVLVARHFSEAPSWHLVSRQIIHPLLVVGSIDSLVAWGRLGARFRFRLEQVAGQPASGLLRLYWSHGPHPLKAGSRWRLFLRLKPSHGLHNPAGFNYGRWLALKGIVATGGVVGRLHYQRLSGVKGFSMLAMRERLAHFIQHRLPEHSVLSPILVALSVGSSSGLGKNSWRVFRRTGTSHLIAISGLHVGLVSGLVYLFVSGCWRLVPRLMLWCPTPKAATLAALLGAGFYAFLAGFSLPTERALIMLTALSMGHLLGRPIGLFQRLSYAFFVILGFRPLSIFSASFWMSFLAVAWVGYLLSARVKTERRLYTSLRLQVGLTLGLAPISLYYFQSVSLVSFPANLIAIPVITLLIVPLCLLMSVFFFVGISVWAGKVLFIAQAFLAPLWCYLVWLAHFPFAVWWQDFGRLNALLLAVLGASILLMPRGLSGRVLGPLFFLPLFFPRLSRPAHSAFQATVLDVGQGLSVVIETQRHLLVFDTGPRSYGGFDAGQAVLVPFLRWRHWKRVDKLIVSHGDLDHRGGAEALFESFPVAQILTSAPWYFRHHRVAHCWVGQHWQWDGVDFAMLHPTVGAPYEGNNSSCVLRVSVGSHSILLPGDIEKLAEAALLRYGAHLSADVLVVPHHGSRTSSSGAFLAAIHPQYAIFSTGFYNRFHFPAKRILARYRRFGIKTLNTAKSGAVAFDVSAESVKQIQTL